MLPNVGSLKNIEDLRAHLRVIAKVSFRHRQPRTQMPKATRAPMLRRNVPQKASRISST